MSDQEKLNLYGWLFTFNPYTGKWAGYHRDVDYFNGDGPVYYGKDVDEVIEKINDAKDGDTDS